ncbi:MAG TPA: carboxypeptidase-like regulatory domain-containing protein [Vicinamibacterales bacterium]|nr:carboxypeptidase-like regulatory domain-containing protein [Vicinamibacterales bacterium]
MRRTLIVVGAVTLLGACNDPMPPSSPSPTPSPTLAAAPTPRFVGSVQDAAGAPVAQAQVEIVDGPQQGQSAITDASGLFSIQPVPPSPVMLHASKPGYLEQHIRLPTVVSGVTFQLDSLAGPFHVYGEFELRLDANPACTQLPDVARSRTYSASMWSPQRLAAGTLRGGDFVVGLGGEVPDWNVVIADDRADPVTISFGEGGIWEHLTPQADLLIFGDARGTAGAETFAWPLVGSFVYCADAERGHDFLACKVPQITCRSTSHRLTLTRK